MKFLLVAAGLFGAAFLVLVIASRLVERAAERRFPPQGRLVAAGDVQLHVVEQGAGPAVVLLHGANGSTGDWWPLARALGQGFRLIAVDRPGHGYSSRPAGPWTPDRQAEAIRAGLDAIGVERPVLVGFSWGGTVAIAFALDHPAEVAGVVTVGAPYSDWPTPVSIAYRLPAWPVIGPAFAYAAAPVLGKLIGDAWSAPAFAPEPLPSGFAEAPWPLALRTPTYLANAEDIRGLKPFLRVQKQRYPGLGVPVEILHGTGDRVVSPGLHARSAGAALPQANLTLIEGAGHMLPYTRPDLVAAAIRRLAGRPAAKPGPQPPG